MKKLLLILVSLFLTFEIASADQLEDGLAAYRDGDYAIALKLLRPLAKQGNAKAQHSLGVMYANGQGVAKDDKEALKWYQLAVKQENTELAEARAYLKQEAEPQVQVGGYGPPNKAPSYPHTARRMGLQGKVVLNVEVLANGSCGQINIAQSSGHAALDNNALSAVKTWHFIPATQAGKAINKWHQVPIIFSLKDN
jgi:TonB family protein